MKKFFFLMIFLLTAVPAYSDSIPSDDCFSLNMWINVDSKSSLVNQNVFNISNLLGGYGAIFCCDSSQPISFNIKSDNAQEQFITPDLSPGQHLLTVNYCSSSPYMGSNNRLTFSKLYIDGVLCSHNGTTVSNLPLFVGGDVVLGSVVVPNSFFYYSDLINQSQMQSLLDFGAPGTIDYYVNYLFWQVISKFRSFF